MKNVEIHRDAWSEVAAAVDWYERRRAGLGLEFLEHYEAALRSLSEQPCESAPHSTVPFRYRRVKRFPYCVYFIEFETHLWIGAVAHHSRQPDYWLDRSPNDQ